MNIIDAMYFSQFVDSRTGEIDWDDVERFEIEEAKTRRERQATDASPPEQA